jgi:hypothetical protein
VKIRFSLKAQKYNNNSLRFTITDKTIKDELIEKLHHQDIIIVDLVDVIKKGEMLKDVKE